jgi:hypothetical protein
VLEGRNVILFPDLGQGCFQLWKQKAAEMRRKINCKIYVSDLLEKNAEDHQKANGYDLADFLLEQCLNPKEFFLPPAVITS